MNTRARQVDSDKWMSLPGKTDQQKRTKTKTSVARPHSTAPKRIRERERERVENQIGSITPFTLINVRKVGHRRFGSFGISRTRLVASLPRPPMPVLRPRSPKLIQKN